jgi:hypothetical protein
LIVLSGVLVGAQLSGFWGTVFGVRVLAMLFVTGDHFWQIAQDHDPSAPVLAMLFVTGNDFWPIAQDHDPSAQGPKH